VGSVSLPSIIHYRSTLDPTQGGVVAHVSDLALLCRDAGARVTIVAPSETPRPKNLDPGGGLAIEAIGKPAMGGVLLSGAQRRRFAELAGDHDVVHLHGAWTTPNFQLASDAMKRGQPYLATPHGMLDDWCLKHKGWKKMPFLHLFGKRYFSNASHVVFCATGELTQSKPWIGSATPAVIPAASDLSPFETLPGPDLARSEVPGAEGDTPVVLFLSRIDPKKGLEVLIDAAGLLVQRGVGFRLVIAGTGRDVYVDELKRRASEKIGDGRFVFAGMVKDTKKVSLYERASVLALSTKQENFGLVLTEALAAKTPVITTKGVDIWPDIAERDAGLITDRTPEAFADAIADILSRPDDARAMGERGRAWVFETMSRDVLSEAFLNVYRAAAATTQ